MQTNRLARKKMQFGLKRSKREVTLTQNDEKHESLLHVVSNCAEKKKLKAYNAFLKELINNPKKAL